MSIARALRFGIWVIIGLNLLLAAGAIGVFVRMSPAIKNIIERNEVSLNACSRMLASLALAADDQQAPIRTQFDDALTQAKGAITEPGEVEILAIIEAHADAAVADAADSRRIAVGAISELASINSEAMRQADRQARRLGRAGAWGVVFMALGVFAASMVVRRLVFRRIVEPFEEIHAVITANREGQAHRRCTNYGAPREVRDVFEGINQILDRVHH